MQGTNGFSYFSSLPISPSGTTQYNHTQLSKCLSLSTLSTLEDKKKIMKRNRAAIFHTALITYNDKKRDSLTKHSYRMKAAFFWFFFFIENCIGV